MHWSVACLVICVLLRSGETSPLPESWKDRETVERPHRGHHHRHRGNDGDIETEISKLRQLDAIIGRVEKAATTHVSLDVSLTDDLWKELSAVEPKARRIADNFSVVALPYEFQRYDVNHDGFVTPIELADSTGTLLEDSAEPFRTADTNGDGQLTESELLNAPWFFASE